eukprot:10761995-Alexandrium_andersonii.AAC.1
MPCTLGRWPMLGRSSTTPNSRLLPQQPLRTFSSRACQSRRCRRSSGTCRSSASAIARLSLLARSCGSWRPLASGRPGRLSSWPQGTSHASTAQGEGARAPTSH